MDNSTFSCLVRYGVKVTLDREGIAAQDEEELEQKAISVDSPASHQDDTDWDRRNLANNGLLLWYKGCQIRIRKAQGGKPPPPKSGIQVNFYEQRLGLEDYYQLRLDFGNDQPYLESDCPRSLTMNLLILWDVNAKFQFLGLRLIKPRGGNVVPTTADWSLRVPHPAELIHGEAVSEHFMFDPDLPLAALADAEDAKKK